MASRAEHLEKARKNEAFLSSLNDDHPEWLVVVAFYKAVHLVEALFAVEAFHSRRHHMRNERLKRKHGLIWTQFKPLFDLSRQVRYHTHTVTAKDARDTLIGKRLRGVEQLVDAAIKQRPKHRR